jgi:DNA-binding transcriptional MerR regulator
MTELILTEATLDELAITARQERDLAALDLVGALGHTIRLGEVLVVIRQRFPQGGWIQWVESNLEISRKTAQGAMRLAVYQEHLPPEAMGTWTGARGELRSPSIRHALTILSGLPDVFQRGGQNAYDHETRDEAKRLRGRGLSYTEIAELLNVNRSTIRIWCDASDARRIQKAKEQRKKQLRAQRRALQDQQRRQDAANHAREVGGALADAYARVRRLSLDLDSALSGAPDPVRASLRDALSLCHRCEDQITAALKTTRMNQQF